MKAIQHSANFVRQREDPAGLAHELLSAPREKNELSLQLAQRTIRY